MMPSTLRNQGLVAFVVMSLFVSGCGGSAGSNAATGGDSAVLQDVARLYFSYKKGNKPAPQGIKQLKPIEHRFPAVVSQLKSGQLVLQWGVGFSDDPDAANKVLAYEKKTADQGGEVLMQDGTIKTMTADELKAASKATGK